MKQDPYGRSSDGRNYVCGLDEVVIPDGAVVLGSWDDEGVLTGVRVEDGNGTSLHQCGTDVAGQDKTPEERVEARLNDDEYASETGF